MFSPEGGEIPRAALVGRASLRAYPVAADVSPIHSGSRLRSPHRSRAAPRWGEAPDEPAREYAHASLLLSRDSQTLNASGVA